MRFLALLIAVSCTSSEPSERPPDPVPVAKQQPAPAAPAGGANAVKVTVLSTMLVGDTPNKGIGEWGFSALVEVDGKKVLFDAGQRAETVLRNAEELKIDLSGVTDVVLSHAHNDHTGGLLTLRRELRKKNPAALGRAHVGTDFFAVRVDEGKEDDNGELRKAYEALGGVWVEHGAEVELLPHAWLTGPVPRTTDERNFPRDNRMKRGGKVVEDDVPEDVSLVIETPEGLVIVAGCGHAGIVNIAEFAVAHRKRKVHAIVGGIHLFNASDDRIAWTASKLKGVAWLLGAHCTGIEALFLLRQGLGLTRKTAAVAGVGATFERGKGIDPMVLAR